MRKNIDAVAVSFTIVGAVIGAGFASGQEVLQFFVRHGSYALWGVILSSSVFLGLVLGLTYYCRLKSISNYQRLLTSLAGQRIGNAFQHAFTIFLWFGLTVMIAGSASLFSNILGLPHLVGGIITAFIVYIVASYKTAGLTSANQTLIPVLLFLLLFLFMRSLVFATEQSMINQASSIRWAGSAFLYVAFNSAILIIIIPGLVSQTGTDRQAMLGASGSIAILGVLLAVLVFLLQKYAGILEGSAIPMLTVAQRLLPELPYLYAIPLWIALVTTAFANAAGLIEYSDRLQWSSKKHMFPAALVGSTLIAECGFAQLVALLYPVMGYVCLLFYSYCLIRLVVKALTH